MRGMLFAMAAIFIYFQSIRGGLLVFAGDIIPVFALGTGQSDSYAHGGTSLRIIAVKEL